jgi:hypothetical protein
MLVGRGKFLIIEVMQQAAEAIEFFVGGGIGAVGGEAAGVGAHAGLHRQGVFPQALGLGVLTK